MHPNSLKNLKPWVKGQSGFGGLGRLPAELRGIKSLCHSEVVRLISKYARMSYEELQSILEAKTAPVLELAFASILNKGIEFGDFTRISFLLDRSIGKVRETTEEEDDMDVRQELQKMSMNELLTLVKSNIEPSKGGISSDEKVVTPASVEDFGQKL